MNIKIEFMAQGKGSIIQPLVLVVKQCGGVQSVRMKGQTQIHQGQTKRNDQMSIDTGYVAVCDGIQKPRHDHKPCPKRRRTEVFPTRWEARQEAVRMGFRFLRPDYDIGDIFACPYCTKEYSMLGLLNNKLAR